MLQSSQAKFEKWIKIRIGEPLTAIDTDDKNAIFGSISGYVGFFIYENLELKYIGDVFEEIIRGIYIDNLKTYIIVGDVQALIMDNQTKDFKNFRFDRPHNQSICSSTLTLSFQTKVLLLSVAPTQNKDIGIDISTKKNSLYSYDLQDGESQSFFVDMPHLQVPFDYNGQNMLMLEYLKEGKKKLSQLTFSHQPSIEIIMDVNRDVEFVSFVRYYQDGIIYIENHKVLKKLQNKIITTIKSFPYQVVAIDVFKEQIAILDYKGNVTIFTQQDKALDQQITFNILHIPNVPQEILKHKYIFDMGYPYYIKIRYNKMLITSDLGLLIYTLL